MLLRAKGKNNQADMVRNILPEGVECIFTRQAAPLGLGHAILCSERIIGDDPFAVLLADDFLTDYSPGVTTDLVREFEKTGKMQLSVMEIQGSDISNYGVIIPDSSDNGICGLIEKPEPSRAPSNLACIGRYILTPQIFKTLRAIHPDANNEIQLADAINIHAQQGEVGVVHLNGQRFDCGSVNGYLQAISNQAKIL